MALNEGRCLFSFSDLKHGVGVGLLSLALLAVVEVRAHTALVPDASHGVGVATVAGDVGMDLGLLVGRLLTKVVNHQSLECLSGVRLDLVLHDLD